MTAKIKIDQSNSISHAVEYPPTLLFDLPYEVLVKIRDCLVNNVQNDDRALRDAVIFSRICKLTYIINQEKISGININDIFKKVCHIFKEIKQLGSSACHSPKAYESDEVCDQITSDAHNLDEAVIIPKKVGVRANSNIYKAMLKKEAPWSCIKKLFQSIPQKEMSIDIVVLFIKLAGKHRDLETAKKVFEETKLLNNFYDCTYSSLIYAAGQAGDLKTVIEIFNEVKSLKLTNEKTYVYFIEAVGKCGNMELATEAFNEAKSLGIANLYTYLRFIEAAVKNENNEAATEAFNEAKLLALGDIPNTLSILVETDLSLVFEKANY